MDTATLISVAGISVAVLGGYMTLLTLWVTSSIRALSNKIDADVNRLRGEMTTGFAEMRGDLARLDDRVQRLEGRGPLVRP